MSIPIHNSAFRTALIDASARITSGIARPAGWSRRQSTLEMLMTAGLSSAEIDRIMARFDEGED